MNIENIKKVIESIIVNQFYIYYMSNLAIRKKFIQFNKYIKLNKQNLDKKYNKEIKFDFDKKKISKIFLPKSESYSQSNYCYPIENSILCENKYILEYIEPFRTFYHFDKTFTKEFLKLSSYYHFYPKTLGEKETIDNKYFLIWCFICIIQNLDNNRINKNNNNNNYNYNKNYNLNNENNNNIINNNNNENINNNSFKIDFKNCDFLIDLIHLLAKIIMKEYKYLYLILSKYFIYFNKQLKLNNCIFVNSCLVQYKKLFCQICFSYFCKKHSYNKCIEREEVKEIDNINYIQKIFIKITGYKNFVEHFENKTKLDIENCPEDNNIRCYKINKFKYNYNENNDKILDYIKLLDKPTLYLIICFLIDCNITNSCFYSRLFNYKYNCNILMEIILYIENNKNKIDNYLLNYNISLFHLPSENSNLFCENLHLLDKETFIGNNNNHKKGIKYIDSKLIIRNSTSKKIAYIPCNHLGKCMLGFCGCLNSRGFCEKFCSCNLYGKKCENAFPGCKCKDGCKIKDYGSGQLSKCKCIQDWRECDPEICVNCKDCKICKNMNIYYKKYAKTIVKKSEIIPSAGLFANDDIKKNDLIGEYVGEIIEKDELERRSIIDVPFERNYGFELNNLFDVDAQRCGNKIRYMNHGSFGNENCYAKEKYVRGDIRITLYSKTHIKKGQELFFDYNMKNCPWILNYNKLYGKK